MATMAQRRAAARARLSRSRGGRALLGLGGRTGHLAMGAGIGAVSQFAGEMAAEKVGFLRNWYGQPALLGVGAFLMIRRKPTLAYALAGAAGYAAAFNYKLNQFQQGKRQTSPVPVFGSGPPPAAMLAAPKVGDWDGVGAEDYSNAVGF